MIVYFDKENVINYLRSLDDKPMGRDTLRMIKRQLSIHLNFSTDELDEYESKLLEEFQEGVDGDFRMTHGSDDIIQPLIKDSSPYNNGVYLLNCSDVERIKLSNSVLIGSVGEETDTLRRLIINDDYSFHLEKIIGRDITPANHLDNLSLPFRTILVVDRYMFKGPAVGGNIGLYDYNLDKILKKIFQNKKGHSRLIFMFQVKVNVAREHQSYDSGPDLDALCKKIKRVIPKNCPAPEVFLVGVPAGKIDNEHDRYIITNYLRIKSGDSFVYFNSSDQILTKSNLVDFYSLANRSYLKSTNKLVNKISSVIEFALNSHSQYCKVPSGIDPAKVINFEYAN